MHRIKLCVLVSSNECLKKSFGTNISEAVLYHDDVFKTRDKVQKNKNN